MASDGVPATPPTTGPVTASPTRAATSIQLPRGKVLPPGGTSTAPQSAVAISKAIAPHTIASAKLAPTKPPSTTPKATPADKPSDAQALVTQVNKSINESGRPDQFRLDTSTGTPVIQQINPTSGEVVGEYSEEEFPTLAQGLGVSGSLVDTLA
jgi:uncharacterized FlaG/YvyC family protein